MSTMAEPPEMDLVDVDGVELEVHDSGSGEPVVFIHTIRDDWYAVLNEPVLADEYRLVHYHRRGYGNSTSTGVPLSIPEHAADCRVVMEHLDIDRAHIVALSGAGTIQLQLALDSPEVVHTLAVLEPLLPDVWASSDSAEEWDAVLGTAMPLLEAGEIADGVDILFQYLGGPEYREASDQHLPPGWFDRVVEDWEGALQHDFVAMNSWEFAREDASRIKAPVLNLKAANSTPGHQEIHRRVQAWIPHAESAVLPDTAHFMPETNPRGTAEALTEFFANHPMD